MERFRRLPWPEIGILVLAAALRLVLLDIKPPHFDEGVNGWFADQMTRTGYFRYDPTNYHGPLHFYAVFVSQTLFGRNLLALRLPAILASVMAVWMLLRFREFFGVGAARLAGLAMAVSPACVFYGRYSIHESWMEMFGILLAWGTMGLWGNGGRRYLFAVLGAITGMILTKETYVIHVGSFALAGLVLWGWERVVPSRPGLTWARQTWTGRDLAVAAGIGVLVIVFLYSGTFFDFGALRGLYETFGAWFHTGSDAAGHEKTSYDIGFLNWYWISLMARYEWPALIGLAGCIRYVLPSDARMRYLAILSGGVLLAYSVIPYKTPWCVISLLWPFLLLFGTALNELWNWRRMVAVPVVTVALLGSLYQCIRLNLIHPTDEKEPYVYVQTFPEVRTLTEPLLEMARNDPRFYHVPGQIFLESYYPLPWLLGDFTNIGYPKADTAAYDGVFIVAELKKTGEIEPKLKSRYYKRTFRLRDGQETCVVYFRADAFAEIFAGAKPEIEPAAP